MLLLLLSSSLSKYAVLPLVCFVCSSQSPTRKPLKTKWNCRMKSSIFLLTCFFASSIVEPTKTEFYYWNHWHVLHRQLPAFVMPPWWEFWLRGGMETTSMFRFQIESRITRHTTGWWPTTQRTDGVRTVTATSGGAFPTDCRFPRSPTAPALIKDNSNYRNLYCVILVSAPPLPLCFSFFLYEWE